MDDFFMRIVSLTSYLRDRLIHFVEDLLFRDVSRFFHIPAIPSYRPHSGSPCCTYQSSPKNCSPSFEPSDYGTHILIPGRSVRTGSHVAVRKYSSLSFCAIFQGLTFPLYSFKCTCKLGLSYLGDTFSYLRHCCRHLRHIHVGVRSFIACVQRTLQGSSEDIGWLQKYPELPPVEDGTARYMELLHSIRNGEHSLPNSFVYLLIPGLFSNHGPLYFVNTKKFFSKMGLSCHIAKIHSEASVERNAWELKQCIEELYWGSSKRVMLLGHSKGGIDAAAALSIYWSDLETKVAGLALVQSPYGGTPIASDILREGQIADKEARRIMEFIICKIIKGDMRALDDLTYEKRKEFITHHALPYDRIPIISFHTQARMAPGVLATMSHIAHAELPWLPLPSFGSCELDSARMNPTKVPIIIPLSAAMAVCALHLRLRYGEESDGLVTRRDAEVPGSVVVRPEQKLDHGWMVYSSKRGGCEADASEMCEALLTQLVEIRRGRHRESVMAQTAFGDEFEQF
ncbi:hypothetical protein QJS10_CPB18g01060 [Acorus calamus]|uniref:Alpha/beta-Hydrolases superfamily protein n=1 Tax=Acorus calamus TaxID=4465 RepID=A0AAV9CNY2_ACOCL|nr:hypothetical protein QJS10_CPB18g01060 [Acorus calamus]